MSTILCTIRTLLERWLVSSFQTILWDAITMCRNTQMLIKIIPWYPNDWCVYLIACFLTHVTLWQFIFFLLFVTRISRVRCFNIVVDISKIMRTWSFVTCTQWKKKYDKDLVSQVWNKKCNYQYLFSFWSGVRYWQPTYSTTRSIAYEYIKTNYWSKEKVFKSHLI